MKFFFPDSQDTVNSDFDFETERHAQSRLRHRDDEYAHEVFGDIPFDGLLVSKAIVDGIGGAGKYTFPQKMRIRREGVREFFRLKGLSKELSIIGDCGAFSYRNEKTPPSGFTVDEVLEFYDECQFDYGVSVDHVILAYNARLDAAPAAVPEDLRDRQELTLTYAADFLKKHHAQGLSFTPMGVAQGWSPKSYARSVQELQKMGYSYIALGGMVPLKSHDILACLETIDEVRSKGTKMHLLGVTRTEHVLEFERYGVASFDSTSPLRQAFKDERDNYFALDRTYSAIRIPQVEGNPTLGKKIKAGVIRQETARALEKACLLVMKEFSAGKRSVEETVAVLSEYERLYDPTGDHTAIYREVLNERPWEQCPCEVCQHLGYHVILFRGSERNRRRGFHNVWVFYQQLHRELARSTNGRKMQQQLLLNLAKS